MKELTKRVLESGLIDKSTATLMERWGQLDPGASDLIEQQKITRVRDQVSRGTELFTVLDEQFIRKTLEDFVEELELLLQPEALERGVTRLDQPASYVERK